MSTQARYTVRVTKDFLVFSAGHFITLEGDHCERIHGHNWRIAIEVDGPLNAHEYVVDFIALLAIGREIVARLDHRMLLADGSGGIALADEGSNWRASHGSRWWSFPKDECVILPIPNTTTERIAHWIADELIGALQARGLAVPPTVRVELEENFGQTATVEIDAQGLSLPR